MTEPAETRERSIDARSTAWRVIAACAAPALILLSIVVQFLRFHEYSLFRPESLMLIGGAVGIGVLVGLVSRLRSETLQPAFIAILLAVYVFYRPELTDLVSGAVAALAERIGDVNVSLAVVGLVLFFVLGCATWLLRRHLDGIVVAVFGTIVVSTIVLPATTGGASVERGSMPLARQDLPPVIHIILDEHIGLEGLPPEIAESETAARAIRDTFQDFALYGRAYSRFAETQFSLASLMNGDLGEDVVAAVGPASSGYEMNENAWFKRLKDEGYAIRVYQSSWLDICGEPGLVDACYTYSMYSPNALQRTDLPAAAKLKALLGRLYISSFDQLPSAIASMEAIVRFETDIETAPRGVAYVVHLMMPHDGYLYDADCTLLDPSDWGAAERDHGITAEARASLYPQYLEQLICSDRQVGQILDHLKRIGVYDDATIIVHGDHGSRIGVREHILDTPPSLTQQDLRDHYSTLLAVKAPQIDAHTHNEPVPLQRFFAESFLGEKNKPARAGEVLLRQENKPPFYSFTLEWPNVAAPLASSDALQRSSADGPAASAVNVISATPRLRPSIE
jgi:hypothetical protein